jgi:type II secretory pathway pseudopilin PulG
VLASSLPSLRRRRVRAMSLIEVMVSGALLAIGASAMLSSWSTVMTVLVHQRRLSEATNVCRSHLEELLGRASGDPDLNPGTTAVGSVNVFGAPDPAGYRVTYIVLGDTPGPGFVSVTVRAEWTENAGTRSTELLTFRER